MVLVRLKNNFFFMRLFFILFVSMSLLTACGVQKTPTPEIQNTEANTIDIGNKAIYTITGSQVQPIR